MVHNAKPVNGRRTKFRTGPGLGCLFFLKKRSGLSLKRRDTERSSLSHGDVFAYWGLMVSCVSMVWFNPKSEVSRTPTKVLLNGWSGSPYELKVPNGQMALIDGTIVGDQNSLMSSHRLCDVR